MTRPDLAAARELLAAIDALPAGATTIAGVGPALADDLRALLAAWDAAEPPPLSEAQWLRSTLSVCVGLSRELVTFARAGDGIVCSVGHVAGAPSRGVVAAFAAALERYPGGDLLLATRPAGEP